MDSPIYNPNTMANFLTPDRVMYSQTWGWRIYKDGKQFYRASPGTDLADCKPISHFEALAKKGGEWEARFETAEKEDIYVRGEDGWKLTKTIIKNEKT